MIHRAQIQKAYERISPYIRRTPVIDINGGDIGSRGSLTFKLELLQHSGSFKPRGAFMNLLTRDVPDSGVVAASGGNHGAAVAYAAMQLGIPARIFVPTIAAPGKVERIREYGAQVVVAGERYADALARSEMWIEESGALPIHAYDHEATLLGQGTTALELETQAPRLHTVLVAVGGGGFIGGVAAWYAGRVKVVGIEPETSCALYAALEAGEPVDVNVEGIAADSLGARSVGRLMFPIAQACVDHVALVTDESIETAQQVLWSELRIVAEPAGATALAAIISGVYAPKSDERIGVLVCGGNTDAVRFVGKDP